MALAPQSSFVDFERTPSCIFPTQIEEAYAAASYVVNNCTRLNVDGFRVAVAGDGAGGNLAAALTLLSKRPRRAEVRLSGAVLSCH